MGMRILVTGGAGFIGSALIRYLLENTETEVINVDKLTYAGNLDSLPGAEINPRYFFEQLDICDGPKLEKVFFEYSPDAVIHLAAESHVDRSIDSPDTFVQSNVFGTYNLLKTARKYWTSLNRKQKDAFRFQHISTDEVYGALDPQESPFTERSLYNPNSPYSATKAASDHLVRAWGKTYSLPVISSICSNNYGPYQFPEKFIPHMIINALNGKSLPVYGDGQNIRDWIYVEDNVLALYQILREGKIGETYNIGSRNERRNIEVVERICMYLEELAPNRPKGVKKYKDLIEFVMDRPGHDARYALDPRKFESEVNWSSKESFESGLRKTVKWYVENQEWWESVLSGGYRLHRLGKVD